MSHAVETFFEAWGDPNPDTRAATLRAILPTELYYLDPRTSDALTDIDALIGYIAMYTEYAPGASARVVNLSTTGSTQRATVEFAMADGMKQFGQYFIEPDDQSRPARMTGFVGLGEPE
ncbi:molecular chaperone GroEL [Shimia sp.]|uniref:molecular chaperone GroEL n=1 Tax=Shimia sp. TaxID=1954381 RepID=UPI00329866B9